MAKDKDYFHEEDEPRIPFPKSSKTPEIVISKEPEKIEEKAEEQVVEEVKEDVKEKPKPYDSSETPRVLVTNTDAYIWERMRNQPQSLGDVSVEVPDPATPQKHRLTLPDEIKAYEYKYTFRWIFKSKRAIDESCDIKGWVLCNRLLFPDLPTHFFTVNGSIERGDNILGFMPKEKADALRAEPGKRSLEIIQSTFSRHKGNPNFYTPKGDEEEDGNVIGI